jgi:hypothetical protein
MYGKPLTVCAAPAGNRIPYVQRTGKKSKCRIRRLIARVVSTPKIVVVLVFHGGEFRNLTEMCLPDLTFESSSITSVHSLKTSIKILATAQTDRQTDGRTDGRTDGQTDRQTDRQTHTHTHTHTHTYTQTHSSTPTYTHRSPYVRRDIWRYDLLFFCVQSKMD